MYKFVKMNIRIKINRLTKNELGMIHNLIEKGKAKRVTTTQLLEEYIKGRVTTKKSDYLKGNWITIIKGKIKDYLNL